MSNGPFLPVSWSIHTKKVKAIKSSRNNLPPLEKTVRRKKKNPVMLHCYTFTKSEQLKVQEKPSVFLHCYTFIYRKKEIMFQ
jgi:hypothetical protein